ncbi:MAG: LysM peptidoglycan-binding domain-containing protein, partial [Bacteroidia bacterium]|nr:LysM peptidoglycan-binding domain-containing protein [Bacteroidia bacterium]
NDLKTWNELKTSTLTQGQTLKVFVRSSSNITQAPSQSTAKAASKPAQTASSGGAGYTVYKVRSGDSLWTIAQQYPGVSVEDIKKANQLANADKLQPGQTLKIPKAQ